VKDYERVNPIDQVVRDVAAPVLKAAGYRRAGRNFRSVGSRGDVAIVHFGSNRLGWHDAEIIVDLAVAVQPHLDRFALQGTAVEPGREDVAYGFWRDRLWGPPKPDDTDDVPSQHWGLDLEDDEAARRFAAALQEAATRLKNLAERENLIAAIRDPATIPQMFSIRTRHRALAMLLADEAGNGAELEQLLVEIESQEPGGSEFVSWARDRRAALSS